MQNKSILLEIYNRLYKTYGPQHWWPADTPFEVIIGAILTQSAAWSNVEKAINNLKAADVLSCDAIDSMPIDELARLIKPCGYYNVKAIKLKTFVSWLRSRYHDSLESFFANDIDSVRTQLLAIKGIGEETADSIILYASAKPVFVIDAYTRRIISRTGLMPAAADYTAYQRFFMHNLPRDVHLFNEYHALLVNLAKNVCRKKQPDCEACCLKDICRRMLNPL